jgi:hypothetical protein
LREEWISASMSRTRRADQRSHEADHFEFAAESTGGVLTKIDIEQIAEAIGVAIS